MQPDPILQSQLNDPPWALPAGTRLPGTGPIEADGWLRWDDAFAGQMALRDRLIDQRREAVHVLRPPAVLAAQELLQMGLDILKTRADYNVTPADVTRPDGCTVVLDHAAPLLTLGRLVQEDFCILQDSEKEHVLTGAILCFPASWTLAEKIDRPLTGIHQPVDEYDENLARRVQRLFDAVRPGRPMMRANCLLYADPSLHQPRAENAPRDKTEITGPYVRTERQCLLRLPQTGAVVFSIHTTVLCRAGLSSLDQAALEQFLQHHTSS